jgi:hypothetical protein
MIDYSRSFIGCEYVNDYFCSIIVCKNLQRVDYLLIYDVL